MSTAVNFAGGCAVRLRMPNTPPHRNLATRLPRAATRLQRARVRAARGFTLIEIVVAFSILAVGLGIAMQIATGAMRQARNANDYTEAALYAQSLLDNVGVGERLEEGDSDGDFDDRFRWTLHTEPYEIESEGNSPLEAGIAPVELFRIELVVSWQRGKNTQEARFTTLRALTPKL